MLVILLLAKLAGEHTVSGIAHWQIENRCPWRRDATLGQDACTVRNPLVAQVLAVLNSALLALLDDCNVTNARKALRAFNAHPEKALALLTQPL